MVMPARPYLTPEEYVAGEREAETRSEYVDGVAYAMAGASPRHNLIAMNVGGELRAALKSRPCSAYSSDTRVSVGEAAFYAYPDVTVICGEPVFVEGSDDTVANPLVIVEVLSPSTEAYDRGEKFAMYRRSSSLQAYVLVAQDRARIEVYTRDANGRWVLAEARAPGEAVRIEPIDCTLSIDEVYDKVEFSKPDVAPSADSGSTEARFPQET